MWDIIGAIAGPLVKGLFDVELQEGNQAFAQQQQAQVADHYREQEAFARDQLASNVALQREFAQHGVRWRVEDAKEAGLHPMYALTGGGAAFSPNPVVMSGAPPVAQVSRGGNEGYGQAMASALTAFFKSQEKKDEVISSAVQSVAALARSSAISAAAAPEDYRWDMDVSGGGFRDISLQNAFDVQQYQAVPTLSARTEDPSLTPGHGPAFTAHQVSPSFQMLLPSSPGGGTSEALEALSESWELTQAVIHRNVEQFGPEWLEEAGRYFPLSSLAYKVIQNVKNALSYGAPVWDALGHRVRDAKLQRYEDERVRQAENARYRDALRNRGRRNVEQFRYPRGR